MKQVNLPTLLLLCLILAFAFAQPQDAIVDDDPVQVTVVSRDGKKVNHERVMVDGIEQSVITPVEEEDSKKEKHLDTNYDKAKDILRSIKPPAVSKLANFVRKPKGIVGSLVYYTKEIFVFLFMNAPDQDSLFTTGPTADSVQLSKPLSNAVQLLEDGVGEGDPNATFLLADMNFYGNHTHPIDYDVAFKYYKQLADLTGNATAQYMVGFIYATGLAPSIPSDQAKSMLYHTFAAEGGNTRSQMTLAYRQIAGIASARNCDEGVHWYKLVAEKAIAHYRSGPPGGLSLPRDAYRIADEAGGVFGEGASVASAGPNSRQGGPTSDAYADIEDVLEYLHLQSGKGDLKATFGLARMHYDGARGLKKDHKLAKSYFLEVAREYWPNSSNKVRKDVSAGTEKLACKAAGYLGRMFLRGEGMSQSFPIAQKWFTRGISNGDALSQYSMGLMHLHGFGVKQDTVRAAEYFSAAADQDLAVAQTEMGKIFLDQGDIVTASKYFELAIRNSHIEALWYLAEMYEKAVGRERSCGVAAAYYKLVAEKAEAVWSSLAEASAAYEDGEMQKAVIAYLMAAEQGSENAQANVAWLLDQSTPRWSPLTLLGKGVKKGGKLFGDTSLALIHWTRSARQQNVDSLVKMGDYYLSGSGNAENAAACYQAAAESLQSAQAMWNLGWMHENGVGISQDFHLAKRFYDQALETNPKEAYLTVQLSLFKLRWRSWWNGVGPEEELGKRKGRRSFSEWFVDFLEADAAQYYDADDWDGQGEGMPGGDYDYVDGDDDGLMELVLMAGLIGALGWLIWYRQQQRAAEARRRAAADEAERMRAQIDAHAQHVPVAENVPGEDRGVFPEPDQPDFMDWVAGGVGH